jgi:hypothetical protein
MNKTKERNEKKKIESGYNTINHVLKIEEEKILKINNTVYFLEVGE